MLSGFKLNVKILELCYCMKYASDTYIDMWAHILSIKYVTTIVPRHSQPQPENITWKVPK